MSLAQRAAPQRAKRTTTITHPSLKPTSRLSSHAANPSPHLLTRPLAARIFRIANTHSDMWPR